MSPLVEVRNLKKYFKTPRGVLHAVDGVSFSLNAGETLGVVGESGCGKSTLGRCVVRLHDVTDGEVRYEGREIGALSHREFKGYRQQMQMIFQDPFSSLNPRMSVSQIIAEPLIVHRLCANRVELGRRVGALMDTVGLARRLAGSYPHELDGGRRQRIGIARALILYPRLIVCDEAVSALDVSVQAQVLNLLNDLREKLHLTYIFISHNLAVVKYISDRTAVMYAGQIVELGPSEKIMLEPLHPYTQELIAALPAVGKKLKPLTKAADMTENVAQERGCPYQNRCPLVDLRCKSERPPLEQVEPGHFLACWGVTKS